MVKALQLLLIVTLVHAVALAKEFQGEVVRVTDGDTVSILDVKKEQHKVRLIGIDAPEKKQAFGKISKQHLSKLVFGKIVTVEFEKSDRYGRILGKMLFNGNDINLEQLRAGLAWHYKQYTKSQSTEDQAAYAKAESDAKRLSLGLWADPDPVPPWEFRHAGARLPARATP